MFEWLKHAFAIEPRNDSVSEEEASIIDRLVVELERRRMTGPALIFLEMSRPLNYLSAQTLHFLQPVATMIFNRRDYQILAKFLERRESIDILCERLETRKSVEAAAERKSSEAASAHDVPSP